MSSILVTGGAGFIGSHLVERLLHFGHRVAVLDNLSSGSIANLEHLRNNPNLRLSLEDIRNPPVVAELVDSADVVFHLAATVGVFNIIESPVTTIMNNVGGTEAVLAAAARKRKRVVVASTSEVYGKSAKLPFHEDGDLVLGPTSKARWSYAASKAVDEFLALAYWREKKVPTVVVRFFNTIGPRQVGAYGMVVPRFVSQALAGEDLTVFGDGRQSRCFTYVSDVVEWLMLLAASDQAVGEVFNLGSPEEVTVLELAERAIALTGSRSGIRFVPYAKAYEAGFEDMERRVPDIGKITALTGYLPQVGLNEALTRIANWFRENNWPRELRYQYAHTGVAL